MTQLDGSPFPSQWIGPNLTRDKEFRMPTPARAAIADAFGKLRHLSTGTGRHPQTRRRRSYQKVGHSRSFDADNFVGVTRTKRWGRDALTQTIEFVATCSLQPFSVFSCWPNHVTTRQY